MRVYSVTDSDLNVYLYRDQSSAIAKFIGKSEAGLNDISVNGDYPEEESNWVTFCEDALDDNESIIMWNLWNRYSIAKLQVSIV